MNSNENLTIVFASLKAGKNHFNFQLNESFFKKYELLDSENGLININIVLTKNINMFELEFKINGNINLICDICASEYSQKIENYFTQIVKFSNKSIVSSDDDIIFIDANKTSIDLSHYLYELISVSIPAKRIHINKKDCDQNVLNKLTSFETTENNIDPRWSVLKKLNK